MACIRLCVWVVSICLPCLIGCGQPSVPVSDLVQAKQVATQVLDAWKSGSTIDELKKKSPAIIVSDDLWRRKVILNSYRFLDEGAMLGPNARFVIQLNYSDPEGKKAEKSFAYLVTTTPAITFFREDG